MPAPLPAPETGTAAPSTVADTSTLPPSTTSAGVDTGDVSGFEVIEARLGGEPVTLALADDPALRSRGLMGVTDLGSLDGMLFSWDGAVVSSRFTMRNTLIPLHIVFFNADGAFVSSADMVPCEVEDCSTYGSAGPYAFAIEFPAGTVVSTDDLLELDPPE